jgi:hypothetical protein
VGIQGLKMTPEQFSVEYSTAIHGFLKVSKSGIEWTRMDLIFVKFA